MSGSTSTTNFFVTDGLGSVLGVFSNTTSSAAWLSDQLFTPYGTQLLANGNSFSQYTTKGFTGQYNDVVSGLDYYVSRYYDPVAGIFLSADGIEGNVQGMNPYGYVGGNPETWSDPTGMMYACGQGCGGGGSSGGSSHLGSGGSGVYRGGYSSRCGGCALATDTLPFAEGGLGAVGATGTGWEGGEEVQIELDVQQSEQTDLAQLEQEAIDSGWSSEELLQAEENMFNIEAQNEQLASEVDQLKTEEFQSEELKSKEEEEQTKTVTTDTTDTTDTNTDTQTTQTNTRFSNRFPTRLPSETESAQESGVQTWQIGDPGLTQAIQDAPEGQLRIKWAVNTTNELGIIPYSVEGVEMYHSVIFNGDPVLSAGEGVLTLNEAGNYVLNDLDNNSGHYFTDPLAAWDAAYNTIGISAWANAGVMFMEDFYH